MADGIEDEVILVDEADRQIGLSPKLQAHKQGALHRAVSVFVLDGAGRVLLQQRAATKYHSAGLWANTCCSHPRPGETPVVAARRRVREEMGIDCALEPAGVFTYRADVGGGLIEHEVDHVFVGRYDGDPEPNPAEVDAWRWATPREIERELTDKPRKFVVWFEGAFGVLRELDR